MTQVISSAAEGLRFHSVGNPYRSSTWGWVPLQPEEALRIVLHRIQLHGLWTKIGKASYQVKDPERLAQFENRLRAGVEVRSRFLMSYLYVLKEQSRYGRVNLSMKRYQAILKLDPLANPENIPDFKRRNLERRQAAEIAKISGHGQAQAKLRKDWDQRAREREEDVEAIERRNDEIMPDRAEQLRHDSRILKARPGRLR